MDREQSVLILEKALNIANKAGAFTLGDAATIQVAINTLKQESKTTEEGQVLTEVKPLKKK